jgi:predicted restriction endonuclease
MKKSQIKKLDALWSKSVKERAKYRCEYCEKVGYELGGNVWLNSAHIIGRRYRTTRWILENGMCLCYKCHQAYDHHLPQHQDIFEVCIGKQRWERLTKLKTVIAKHQDYEQIKDNLTKGKT